jgi:integrase
MRHTGKLTALAVAKMTKPGRYGDSRGLWLQISVSGSKSWAFRYMRHGQARQMGLGSAADVTLSMAREKALACRRLLLDGIDPISQRQSDRAAGRVAAARAVTFKDAAARHIASHEAGFRAAKTARLWRATLATYADPVFGGLPVDRIDTALVLQVIEPLWRAKPETASRVRQRIEAVLDFAAARGLRSGENPARWRGHLDKLLPARSKVARTRHHAALPYGELPTFLSALQAAPGVAPRALEFAILTAARTSEVIGATWDEIDLERAVWTIPASRMKGGREHRVPLADPVRALLVALPRDGAFVFVGAQRKRVLSHRAMLAVLSRMGRRDLTVHGFRSTFRDWASETTGYPNEVLELALAHAIKSPVEAAYRRGDLLDKRKRLMADWARFCASPGRRGRVVPLRGGEHG